MVVKKGTTIPDEIVFTYIALLKNREKVATAIVNYYTEPTGIGRTRLIQELASPQSGSYSEKIMKANKIVEHVLDIYNTIQPIVCLDTDWVDLDFDEEIASMFLGSPVIAGNINHPFKRIKNV